jgi:phosphoglucomutase
VTKFGDFEVEVIDCVADYLELLKECFDFDMIKALLARWDKLANVIRAP